jgi:hypothetical protein
MLLRDTNFMLWQHVKMEKFMIKPLIMNLFPNTIAISRVKLHVILDKKI